MLMSADDFLSILQAIVDALHAYLLEVGQVLWEQWAEGAFIIGAVWAFLYIQATPLVPRSGQFKKAKAVERNSSAERSHIVAKQNRAAPSTTRESFAHEDLEAFEVQQVSKLLAATLVRRGGGGGGGYSPSTCSRGGVVDAPSPEALLDQYEGVVHRRGVNLGRRLADHSHARSLYVCLINAAFKLGSGGRSRASALLVDMRRFGFARDQEFFMTIMKSLVGQQLHAEELWLHDEIMADGILLNQVMYINLMNSALALGQDDKALEFFSRLDIKEALPMRTYMAVLRVHGKRKDWKAACALFNSMQARGSIPDTLMLNNLLGLCVASGQISVAEELLDTWKNLLDVISCNIVLKGYAHLADFSRSEAMLQRMIDFGPSPNIISFNTVMDCAVRSTQIEDPELVPLAVDQGPAKGAVPSVRRPWDLLEKLMALGLEPDRYTCSTLVKGMHLAGCSAVDLDRVMELLRRIGATALHSSSASVCSGAPSSAAAAGAPCNARLLEVLFNTLLDACVSLHDLERMGCVFEMMQEFNVGVSAVTFGTLIKAFGQAHQLAHCHEVWQRMADAKIRPTVVTYGCYIDACIRNDDLELAENIFNSMSVKGENPNGVIYTSLIRGFAAAKQPAKAFEMYSRMRKDGIEATPAVFNSVIDVIARQLHDPEKLQQVINDMQGSNLVPDSQTYSAVLKSSCSVGNVEAAVSLYKQTRARGIVFDQAVCNGLLLSCSRDDRLSDAEYIFEDILRSHPRNPSHVTTSIMVKMYGKMKMLDKAIAVNGLVESRYGQKPNLYVYTCLIQACVHNKQVRRSWEIFERMLRSGVEPDAITYGTVVHGCIYFNRFELAVSLVRHAYCVRDVGVQHSSITNSAGGQQGEQQVLDALEATRLEKPVPLQQDVLKLLSAAMKRKGCLKLCEEVQAIVTERPVADVAAPRRPAGARRR